MPFPFQTPGYEDMEVSTQLIIKEALSRGVTVEIIDRKDNFIRLKRGDKIEYVKQATKTSKDSYVTFLMMENKHVTKFILAEKGLRVPQGKLFHNLNEAETAYEEFSRMTVVVKPLTTNFGIGITFVPPDKPDEYRDALKMAFKYDKSVIVEEYIPGKEYRFLVIDEKTVAVTHRVPANVTGDGKQTIRELVAAKNSDPLRTFGIPTPLNIITLGETEATELAKQGLNFESRLNAGQTVFLRKNSNISTGGDPIDFTDDGLDDYKKIAEYAAKAFQAKLCGLDMIINDIKKPADAYNYAIIELNFNPTLGFHDWPAAGKNRMVEKAVLDVLGF